MKLKTVKRQTLTAKQKFALRIEIFIAVLNLKCHKKQSYGIYRDLEERCNGEPI